MRTCSRCKGSGSVSMVLRNHGTKSEERHIVVCPQFACHGGKIDEAEEARGSILDSLWGRPFSELPKWAQT